MSLPQALALHVDGRPLAPMALVAADGGDGYWHAHPGDDPMAMVIDELIPLCQARGLGRLPQPIGVMGISMGGYGALLMAEKHPQLFAAVAAISPAVWTTYAEAEGANAGAYSSAADFAANDAVTHARALARIPVRVASGSDRSLPPGVVALSGGCRPAPWSTSPPGCHTGPFFRAQEPPSLAFLALLSTPPRDAVDLRPSDAQAALGPPSKSRKGSSRLAGNPIRSPIFPTDTRRRGREALRTLSMTTATRAGSTPFALVLLHHPDGLAQGGGIGVGPVGEPTSRRLLVKSVRTFPGWTSVTWIPNGATS